MRHILRPAVEAVGYIAIRADEIDKPGIITSQVLSQVVDAELVIADLTERNPNVFYELAIRHATSKLFVQLIRKGETIPFDVAGTRTVIFDLHDPDSVEDARKSVTKQIEALETDSTDIETPISVSLDLQRLRQSEDPEQRSLADILSALSEVRSELSNLGEIGEKSVETVTARLSQSDTGRHRYGIGYQRIAHHIADVSESVFGFVILLSSFREQVPWLYEIGMEAHRRAANGDPDRARMAFDEMIRLMKVAERVDQGIPAPIVAELPRSFERMVRLYQNRSMSEELPW